MHSTAHNLTCPCIVSSYIIKIFNFCIFVVFKRKGMGFASEYQYGESQLADAKLHQTISIDTFKEIHLNWITPILTLSCSIRTITTPFTSRMILDFKAVWFVLKKLLLVFSKRKIWFLALKQWFLNPKAHKSLIISNKWITWITPILALMLN